MSVQVHQRVGARHMDRDCGPGDLRIPAFSLVCKQGTASLNKGGAQFLCMRLTQTPGCRLLVLMRNYTHSEHKENGPEG